MKKITTVYLEEEILHVFKHKHINMSEMVNSLLLQYLDLNKGEKSKLLVEIDEKRVKIQKFQAELSVLQQFLEEMERKEHELKILQKREELLEKVTYARRYDSPNG